MLKPSLVLPTIPLLAKRFKAGAVRFGVIETMQASDAPFE
jgi:hypothetical protein